MIAPLLDELWKIILFIGIQYTLGRRGSYPYGLLVDFNLVKITFIVIISDMIQTLILLNLFEYSFEKIPFLKKFKNWLETRKKKSESKKTFWVRLKKWEGLGIIAVAALPYGGGALSGSILAVSLKMNKKKAYFLIITGCVIGSILFYLGFAGIISLLK